MHVVEPDDWYDPVVHCAVAVVTADTKPRKQSVDAVAINFCIASGLPSPLLPIRRVGIGKLLN